jgi:sarcosine oxidase subunit beta
VSQTADVVIIGAGIIGGSIAFHLLERDPRLRVVMLEKESEPGTGATSKATGGVRFQFSTEARGLRLFRARLHALARHRHPDDRDAP